MTVSTAIVSKTNRK